MAADRKRRLTAPTSPGRRNGPSQGGPSITGAEAGSSLNAALQREPAGSYGSNAIDLTSDDDERPLPPAPPAPPPPLHPIPRTNRPTIPRLTSMEAPQRPSDFRLPRWQPDTDVSQCPVCNTSFSFWYRKHHCRKCGRVVCAGCSPHRITLPRQYIVRQPEPPGGIMDLTAGDTSPTTPQTPMQLWGGEEVRVCNPCVPDPNLSPPPQYTPNMPLSQRSPDRIPAENWRFPADATAPTLRQPPRRHINSMGPLPPLPGLEAPGSMQPGQMPTHPHMGHRSTASDASAVSQAYNRMIAQSPYMTHQGVLQTHGPSLRDLYAPPSAAANPSYYLPRTSSAEVGTFGTSAPSHLPAPAHPYRNRSMIDVADPRAVSVHAPAPRRQIAEEDECPVCSEELPPKGPNGETADRERHVEECIASHVYTATPPSRTVSAPPDTAEAGASSSTTLATPITTGLPTASTSATPSGSMPSGSAPLRQRRMTGGRMLVYKATEKDCTSEDGTEAECVICFEEFETGDEMGRLECLCRFHRVRSIT